MTTARSRKLKMYMSLNSFFKDHASVFNPLPHFPPEITALDNLTNSIFQEESRADSDMSGFTIMKNDSRAEVERLSAKVGFAVGLWGLANGQPEIIDSEDYQPGNLASESDSEMYVLAVQLHAIAQPVEGSLGPYNSGPADVSALAAAAQSFLPQIKVPGRNRKSRTRSIEKIQQHFKDAEAVLEKLDNYMVVYQYNNNKLWLEYRSARKLVKTGGGKNVHTKRGFVSPAHIAYAPFSEEVLKATSKLTLSNQNKTGSLVFYFSPSPKALPTLQTKMLSVAPGKTTETTATAAGYTALSPYLMVYNPNASKGKWKTEIVKK